MVEKKDIKLNNLIPAEDENNVSSFLDSEAVESIASENLFGKWLWYSDEMDREIRDAYGKNGPKKQILYEANIVN